MKNFFTSIERNNDSYIGVVHNTANNQPVYRTAEYSSHVEAIKDINAYLQGDGGASAPQQYVVNTSTQQQVNPVEPVTAPGVQASAEPPRRCCGR